MHASCISDQIHQMQFSKKKSKSSQQNQPIVERTLRYRNITQCENRFDQFYNDMKSIQWHLTYSQIRAV